MGKGPAVIIERIVMGRYVKVVAIDPATGTEVTVVADASAPPAASEQLAVRKLSQRLSREKIS